MKQSGHPSVSEQDEFGDQKRSVLSGFQTQSWPHPTHEAGLYPAVVKIGILWHRNTFSTLWNDKAHESKQSSLGWGCGEKNGFGKTENELLCSNSFRSLHTHIGPQPSLYLWVLLAHGSPGSLSPVHRVIRL